MEADRRMQAPAQPTYVEWNNAGNRVVIKISLDLVERLSRELRRASPVELESNPTGLLLGYSVGYPNPVTYLEDYKIIDPEEETDPKKAASHSCGRAVAGWPRSARLYPVGFFRAQAVGWLSLSERDLQTAKRFFPEPDKVILLIRFNEQRETDGAFFTWEDGKLRSDAQLEFPFSVARLADQSWRGSLQAGKDKPASEPAASVPEPAAVTRWRDRAPIRWRSLIPTAAVVTAAALAAQFAWEKRKAHEKPPQTILAKYQTREAPATAASLGLRAVCRQRDIVVNWDKTSSAILDADHGTLTFKENVLTRMVPLDRKLLRDGEIVYMPLTTDINVRLEVFPAQGASASESILLLTNGPRAPEGYIGKIDRTTAEAKPVRRDTWAQKR